MTPLKLLLAGLLAATMATSALAQVNPIHNFANPADVDGNLRIDVKDALIVVNELEALRRIGNSAAFVPLLNAPQPYYYFDTTNDSAVTARDALLVINHLATASVPEPATFVTATIGLLALAGYGIARRRARAFGRSAC